MTARGLTERRSLRVIGMSASALRYQPRPDRNGALRDRIVALAQRHRRYGASMIYLKLRQALASQYRLEYHTPSIVVARAGDDTERALLLQHRVEGGRLLETDSTEAVLKFVDIARVTI